VEPSAINPVDLSIWHLVMQADMVVKAVMILLAAFSFMCWSVMFAKFMSFISAGRAVQKLETTLESGTLEDMINYSDAHTIANIIEMGNNEWHDGAGEHAHEALHEVRDRIERAMRLELSNENRRLNAFLPLLATVGSSSPFIGLFGTVWGIMNTFTGIGASHDTSLATVAPGIAEALIATAIGLFAAIPSIMAYNYFTTRLTRLTGRLGTCIGIYSGRLSKRLAPNTGA